MSPADFFRDWARRGAWLLTVASTGAAIWLAVRTVQAIRAVRSPAVPAAASPTSKPVPADWTGVNWDVLHAVDAAGPTSDGELAKRFRLAGTFFEFTAMGSGLRRAILDDAKTGNQLLLAEGDFTDGVEVAQIMRDRVTLRDSSGRETVLYLDFSDGAAKSGPDGANGQDDAKASTARFGGNRVGERRWVFQRESLLGYYQELRDQPERLVLLFDSLKPEYNDQGGITGYRLGAEGEREFFDAVGLQEGDVVRKVNNVDMTNRRRAEFFIKQFAENEASAFMIDVEREGTTNRMVYEVR
jgi:type II secretion system protein C